MSDNYETAVQREMLVLARRIGALRETLTGVRDSLKAHLPNIGDDGIWAALTDCVERIDRALTEKEI